MGERTNGSPDFQGLLKYEGREVLVRMGIFKFVRVQVYDENGLSMTRQLESAYFKVFI